MEHIISLLDTIAAFWLEGSAPLYKSALLMEDEDTLRQHIERAANEARAIRQHIRDLPRLTLGE